MKQSKFDRVSVGLKRLGIDPSLFEAIDMVMKSIMESDINIKDNKGTFTIDENGGNIEEIYGEKVSYLFADAKSSGMPTYEYIWKNLSADEDAISTIVDHEKQNSERKKMRDMLREIMAKVDRTIDMTDVMKDTSDYRRMILSYINREKSYDEQTERATNLSAPSGERKTESIIGSDLYKYLDPTIKGYIDDLNENDSVAKLLEDAKKSGMNVYEYIWKNLSAEEFVMLHIDDALEQYELMEYLHKVYGIIMSEVDDEMMSEEDENVDTSKPAENEHKHRVLDTSKLTDDENKYRIKIRRQIKPKSRPGRDEFRGIRLRNSRDIKNMIDEMDPNQLKEMEEMVRRFEETRKLAKQPSA